MPASLLSPELCLFESNCGETLGGLALSLATLGELSAVDWRSIVALARTREAAGGECRSDTDLWAGARRGWRRVVSGGMVPGGSCMVAITIPQRVVSYE
jgi:hypothetical protein